MSDEIVNLISKKFIARPDVKAIQRVTRDQKVIYTPHLDRPISDPEAKRIPWSRDDLNAHLAGDKTFGHYLLNTDDKCKLFVFDIDLAQTGILPRTPRPDLATVTEEGYEAWEKDSFQPVDDLRAAWHNRADPARDWMKLQFKLMAHKLAKATVEELEVPCAVAYSGNKGVHVYGFVGDGTPMYADTVREGARNVLDVIGEFEPMKGDSFYRTRNQDPITGFPNLEIEIYPKQDSIDGKDLGNLVRLPLGRNLKNAADPTFFIDMTTGLADMKPLDPVWALTEGAQNPWRRPGE